MRQREKKSGFNSVFSSDVNWNGVVFWGLIAFVALILTMYIYVGPKFQSKAQIVSNTSKQNDIDEMRQIPVYEGMVNVLSDEIHYRQTFPENNKQVNNAIILLHGEKYSSSTWKGLGTLQLLAQNGYRAIAVDLPKYGLSKKATGPRLSIDSEIVAWMEALIDRLKLNQIVLVVPSAAGKYGLPYLLKSHDNKLIGFVAMSPSYTNAYDEHEYEQVRIPVVNIWGAKDKTGYPQESNHWLEHVSNYQYVMVENGEHTPFVGNKMQFHKELLQWLKSNCKGLNYDKINPLDDEYDEDEEYDNNIDNDYDDDYDNDYDNNQYIGNDNNDPIQNIQQQQILDDNRDRIEEDYLQQFEKQLSQDNDNSQNNDEENWEFEQDDSDDE